MQQRLSELPPPRIMREQARVVQPRPLAGSLTSRDAYELVSGPLGQRSFRIRPCRRRCGRAPVDYPV